MVCRIKKGTGTRTPGFYPHTLGGERCLAYRSGDWEPGRLGSVPRSGRQSELLGLPLLCLVELLQSLSVRVTLPLPKPLYNVPFLRPCHLTSTAQSQYRGRSIATPGTGRRQQGKRLGVDGSRVLWLVGMLESARSLGSRGSEIPRLPLPSGWLSGLDPRRGFPRKHVQSRWSNPQPWRLGCQGGIRMPGRIDVHLSG